MTHETDRSIIELIQLLRDGESFYSDAAHKVEAPIYRNLFLRMAHIKYVFANELTFVARRSDTRADNLVATGRWWQTYAGIRVGIGKAAEKIYLTLLAETEEQILEILHSHLQCSTSTTECAILLRRLPEAHRAHADLRDLKLRLDRRATRVFPSLSAKASPAHA